MTTATEAAEPASVVMALYLRTKTLHTEAEKTGVIRDMLRGDATRDGYVLFLRNLLPAYQQLEAGLARHQDAPAMAELAAFRLDRAPAITADLDALCGPGWAGLVPLLPAGEAYARRVEQAAEGDGARLIAHAYARYLGDLSGGLILQRLLAKSLALQPGQLSMYDFPRFSDLAALKSGYREALDRAALHVADPDAVVEEGAVAFSHNIALSLAVQDRVAPSATVAHEH